jgi:hypothetical protein
MADLVANISPRTNECARMVFIVLRRRIERLVKIKQQRLMYARCKEHETDSNIR